MALHSLPHLLAELEADAVAPFEGSLASLTRRPKAPSKHSIPTELPCGKGLLYVREKPRRRAESAPVLSPVGAVIAGSWTSCPLSLKILYKKRLKLIL